MLPGLSENEVTGLREWVLKENFDLDLGVKKDTEENYADTIPPNVLEYLMGQ